MQLEKWLKQNGHTKIWLANKLGIEGYRVTRLLNGVGIDVTIVKKVMEITEGVVNIDDWVKLEKKRCKK